MSTLTAPEAPRKAETGLIRGQVAKIARIHRVSETYVRRCAQTGKGRASILATIDEYRARNAAATRPADSVDSLPVSA